MRTSILFALSCFSLGAACASADSTSYRTAVRYDEHLQAGSRAAKRDITIEDRVASVCDFEKSSSFFASGSADEVDYNVVAKLADCMRDGALEDEKVVVIGYTDPAGSTSYNKLLGLQRAETIAAALVAKGVERDRLFIKSYGEQKARDKRAQEDWQKDRKVTLRVAEPGH